MSISTRQAGVFILAWVSALYHLLAVTVLLDLGARRRAM